MLDNKIIELITLIKNLNNINFKVTTKKDIIKTHEYNLNLQENTYNNLITFQKQFLKEIKSINQDEINNYHNELLEISETKSLFPKLEEANIDNYISLKSINIIDNLIKETKNFYQDINKIITKVENDLKHKEEIQKEIKNINLKIEKLINEQKQNIEKINIEEKRIENEIKIAYQNLNKLSFIHVFKKDSINSKIDLLKNEYQEYENNKLKVTQKYQNTISKLEKELKELK